MPMAKEKLFPAQNKVPDKRQPHERFTDFASKVVNVSKAEIDAREKQWQRRRPKS